MPEIPNKSQKSGKDGEELAKKHLLALGYSILESNWRFRRYEVDIIARLGGTIVFVEVKTRKNDIFGEPEVFVTPQKQRFLIAAANQYVIRHNCDLDARFDIIAIVQINNNPVVKHLEDAFRPQAK